MKEKTEISTGRNWGLLAVSCYRGAWCFHVHSREINERLLRGCFTCLSIYCLDRLWQILPSALKGYLLFPKGIRLMMDLCGLWFYYMLEHNDISACLSYVAVIGICALSISSNLYDVQLDKTWVFHHWHTATLSVVYRFNAVSFFRKHVWTE